MNRRNFVNASALGAGATLFVGLHSFAATASNGKSKEENENGFSMTEGVSSITIEEIKSRISKAQRLMQEQQIGALLLDAGTSLQYFTGLSWWPSEGPIMNLHWRILRRLRPFPMAVPSPRS